MLEDDAFVLLEVNGKRQQQSGMKNSGDSKSAPEKW